MQAAAAALLAELEAEEAAAAAKSTKKARRRQLRAAHAGPAEVKAAPKEVCPWLCLIVEAVEAQGGRVLGDE